MDTVRVELEEAIQKIKIWKTPKKTIEQEQLSWLKYVLMVKKDTLVVREIEAAEFGVRRPNFCLAKLPFQPFKSTEDWIITKIWWCKKQLLSFFQFYLDQGILDRKDWRKTRKAVPETGSNFHLTMKDRKDRDLIKIDRKKYHNLTTDFWNFPFNRKVKFNGN